MGDFLHVGPGEDEPGALPLPVPLGVRWKACAEGSRAGACASGPPCVPAGGGASSPPCPRRAACTLWKGPSSEAPKKASRYRTMEKDPCSGTHAETKETCTAPCLEPADAGPHGRNKALTSDSQSPDPNYETPVFTVCGEIGKIRNTGRKEETKTTS